MCFSALWIVQTLIWLIVLCAIVAILRLIVPYVLSWLGVAGGIVMQVINIIIAVVVLIALIWFVYDLITCLGGMSPRMR